MYYYLTFEDSNGSTRNKVWEIVERKQRGWCKLAWTYSIDDGVISPTPTETQNPGYLGRIVKIMVEGNQIEVVKIFAPMGTGGRDDWHYTICAEALEEIA